MQVIQTKPFDPVMLREKIQEAFPQYIIKNVLGGGKNSFQVRAKKFTLTRVKVFSYRFGLLEYLFSKPKA